MSSCPKCRRRLASDAEYCPYDGTPVPREVGVGSVLAERYHIIGELGRGGMGTVYRAWQSDLDRPVAIKVLHPHLASEPELRHRFRREARAVAMLSHANVVSLYDVGEHDDGSPYLVMEYVSGVALDEAFAEGTRLPGRRALRLVRQVASALAAAHEAGIVHRDLKLANLLLSIQTGEPDTIKVVDFGIAKLVGGSASKSIMDLTRMGEVCGTPEYMAPEQAKGEPLDHRCDYYSLGVVLYRLVTGKTPYGRTGMAAAVAHVEEPVPDPRDTHPDTPRVVAELIMRLMAKEPGERPADGAELLAAIDWALVQLDRRPSATVIEEPLPRLELSVPADRRSGWGLVALVLCLLIGGLGLFAALVPSTPDPRVERSMAPARGLEPLPSGSVDEGPRRAVVTSTATGTVRVLLPLEPEVDRPQVVLIDLWTDDGKPAAEPVSATVIGPDGAHSPVQVVATDMPGRYRIDRRFADLGVHQVVVEVADTELAISLEVVGDSGRS
ncbi:MAG: protein kinase [Deltaproteobacteria bacterium]|jgi:predicted Ser/Thr protein kinase|nr:protein kinase [Deltaproteobacteria bacterium]